MVCCSPRLHMPPERPRRATTRRAAIAGLVAPAEQPFDRLRRCVTTTARGASTTSARPPLAGLARQGAGRAELGLHRRARRSSGILDSRPDFQKGCRGRGGIQGLKADLVFQIWREVNRSGRDTIAPRQYYQRFAFALRAWATCLSSFRCHASRRHVGTPATSDLFGGTNSMSNASPLLISIQATISFRGMTPRYIHQFLLVGAISLRRTRVNGVTFLSAQSVQRCSTALASDTWTERRRRFLSTRLPSRPRSLGLPRSVSQTPTLPWFLTRSVGTSPTVNPYFAIPRICSSDV